VVLGPDSNPVSDVVIHFWNSSGLHRTVTPNSAGAYSVIVPPGSFSVEVLLPTMRSDLLRPAAQYFTVKQNETKEITFTLQSNVKVEKIITGKITDEIGSLVSDAVVSAYNRSTGQWTESTITAGTYRIPVGPGTWSVTLRPVDNGSNKWVWLGSPLDVAFTNDPLDVTKEVNFKVKQARSKVTIILADDEGNPVGEAGVSIEYKDQKESQKNIQYKKTDIGGEAEFWLNPGSYLVRGFTLSEKYINPDEKNFDISVGMTKEVYLMFKSRTANKISILGTASFEDGTPVAEAFVWAWSDKGGYVNVKTDTNGAFSFSSLSDDKWHIGAAKVVENVSYKAAESIFNVGKSVAEVRLKIVKFAQLPNPVAVSSKAADPVVAIVKTGASVYVPAASAPATSSITVSIIPSADTPSRPDARIVGPAYDISVTDAKGSSINRFSNELEVTLPYFSEALKELGVSENSIVPGYFDEKTGAWIRETNYYINKEKKIIVVRVKHLTRFALVAPADVTPPASPTKIAYAIRKPGSVKLSWINPTADFHHVRIYRSETKTGKSVLLNDLVFGTTFQDSNLKKKTYYYSVKAVDAAGNESKTNKSVAVNAAKTNVPTKITVGLQKNSKGAVVQLLQEVLVVEGYLPSDYAISGKFDDKVVAAIKDFQSSNDLPATGKVGSKTAALLNKLIK
jgi:hypothetical protein